MLDGLKSKLKGQYAACLCEVYLLSQGYLVMKPTADSGKYDLSYDDGSKIWRVQSKWTSNERKGQHCYEVTLQVQTGSNVSYRYSPGDFDFLWVATPRQCYMIPEQAVFHNGQTKRSLKLFPQWDAFSVHVPVPSGVDEHAAIRLSSRLSEEEKKMAVSLVCSGKSHAEVAQQFGVSRSCISMLIHRRTPIVTNVDQRPVGVAS